MSLTVRTYLNDETGRMIFQEQEDYGQSLAGVEVCRTSLYGSELAKRLGEKAGRKGWAKRLGLVLLPTLAATDISAYGEEVTQLQAEAKVILQEATAFAEQAHLRDDYVRHRVGNIRQACTRAKQVQGGVVIW